jgi:hypothetical protein
MYQKTRDPWLREVSRQSPDEEIQDRMWDLRGIHGDLDSRAQVNQPLCLSSNEVAAR